MTTETPSPKGRKLLPSNAIGRDIAAEWKSLYAQLRSEGWNITESIDRIRASYGNPSRGCVRWTLFPKIKEKQRKYSSKHWANMSLEQNAKYSAHKAEYRRVVRHLDDALAQAFTLAAPRTALPLEEIADYVQQATGVYVRPPTLLRASERYARERGNPILSLQQGSNPPQYRLISSSHSG